MSQRTIALLVAALCTTPLCLFVGCSSDDPAASPAATGGSAGQGSGGAAGSASTGATKVTAATGGTVVDPSGKATLSIPAGALAKDTDITLVVSAPEAGTASDVLDFGPDGTTFLIPATLEIKADASKLPMGKTYAIAIYEAGAWAEVKGSTFAGGAVKGAIAHFTKYSVILVNGDAVINPVGACVDIIKNFKPCGGDLVGTWVYTDVCIDGPVGEDPFHGTCPQATISAELDRISELTFDGSAFTQSEGSSTVTKIHASFPTSCLGSGKTCAQAEADLSKQENTTGKCTETGSICTCDSNKATSEPANTKAYTLGTNTFDHEGKSTEYCVSGTSLIGRDVGTKILSVLTKK